MIFVRFIFNKCSLKLLCLLLLTINILGIYIKINELAKKNIFKYRS